MIRTVCTLVLLAGVVTPASKAWGDTLKPRTRVFFVDACTGESTNTMTSQGASVVVMIEGLRMGDPVSIDLVVEPFTTRDESNPSAALTLRKIVQPKPSSDGKDEGNVRIERKIHLKKFWFGADVGSKGRLWLAQMKWMQKGSRLQDYHAGQAQALLYVMKDDTERFYTRTGPNLSVWASPIKISSDYKYNASKGEILFSSEEIVSEAFGYSKSAYLGIAPIVGVNSNSVPLLNGFSQSLQPWVFGGWAWFNCSREIASVSRKWKLASGEGGFFGTRTQFTRIPVQEEAFRPPGKWFQCGKWETTRKGVLDVGVLQKEFYVVPRSQSGSSEAAEGYLNQKYSLTHDFQLGEAISDSEENAVFFSPAKES